MSKAAININELSPAERLSLIEELWDSLSDSAFEPPLTETQRNELDRHLDDLERDGPQGIPWDEVVETIRKRPM